MLIFLHTHFCTHTKTCHTFVVCATISTCHTSLLCLCVQKYQHVILLYFVYVCTHINMSYFVFLCVQKYQHAIILCFCGYVCKNINMSYLLYVCKNINMSYFFFVCVHKYQHVILLYFVYLGTSWTPLGLQSCVGIALTDATGTTVAGCIRGLATAGRTSPEPATMERTNTAPIFCCHLGFESARVDESFVANRARRFARDPAHLQAYRVDCGFQFMCLCQRSCRCAVS